MMIKKTILFVSLLSISACSSQNDVTKVQAMQKKDKRLSCQEILLEMNEAEFYRKVAHKNKGPKLKNVLMPLGYISTYMDAEEAIGAAQARVDYLDKIYNIMRCEEKEEQQYQRQGYGASYAPPIYAAPAPTSYSVPAQPIAQDSEAVPVFSSQ